MNISDIIDIWVPIINFIDTPAECNYGRSAPPGDARPQYAGLVAQGKVRLLS